MPFPGARLSLATAGAVAVLLAAVAVRGEGKAGCSALPDHAKLHDALQRIVQLGKNQLTGMGNQRWAVVVDRDGLVCAVVYSGEQRGDQWPGSRGVAAQKAHTANAFSKPDYALSSGNLFAAAQPGESLYGLITLAPPNPNAAYGGNPASFGSARDPMIGKPVGGVVVFGGGLALYDAKGKIVGGLGVSGDTSCSDHIVAWKLRHDLKLDAVPAGPALDANDNLILDFQRGTSVSGFGHPSCKGGKPSDDVIKKLPESDPTGQRP